jgi:hypothetical protein
MRRTEDEAAPRGANRASPERETEAAPGASKSSVTHSSKRRVYRLTTPFRTFRADIRETPRRIKCVLRCSREGELGDEAEIKAWIGQVFAYLRRFKNDPRPLETVLPNADLVCTTYCAREGAPTTVVTDRATPEWKRDALALGSCAGAGVHYVSIYHDSDCPQLHGVGPCNCDAVVRYGRPDRRDVQ